MVLFAIETGAVWLVWSRGRAKPPVVAPGAAARRFGLRVEGGRGVTPDVQFGPAGDAHLFEQTSYTFFVQSKTGAPLTVRHRDPVLTQALHAADGGRVVHGPVNFGAQVGHSRFSVVIAGRPHFDFEVEIFPSKLDYRDDYAALRADVQDIAADLVYEYLRATYFPGTPRPAAQPPTLAWATLLRHWLGDLERALGYVTQHPLWGTDRTVQATRAHRIRRPDAALRRAVRQGATLVHERLPAHRPRYTLDTPAHRWLAAQLTHLRRLLASVQAEEAALRPGVRRATVLEELGAMQRRLDRLARLEPMREAAPGTPPAPSLQLMTAPGYREAYRACLLLRQGLSLEGEALRLPLKDLHLLYEYWCFLTLVRLAAEAAGQPLAVDQLVKVERHGLRLRLRKGRAQTVTFGLGGGRRLSLTYNPRFSGRGFLVPQQPDIVLTLHETRHLRARYVLDAKYRLDASPTYLRRYGTPGPPLDALNTLHRYRDALNKGQRGSTPAVVVQAVALFPYREEKAGSFAQHRHARALREVGVGALPLLPGATGYVEAWLREVIQ